MDNEALNKKICNEIQRECTKLGRVFNVSLVEHYVKLLRLNPVWGLTNNCTSITRSNIQKFIQDVVSRIADPNDPEWVALRLQFHYSEEIKLLDGIHKRNRKELDDKLYILKLFILEPPFYKHRDFDWLVDKLVYYSVLVTGLGNPGDHLVYLETIQVLKSIWNAEDLLNFFNLQYCMREEELRCLVKISAGIRLYNMDCDKGGYGISPLPRLFKTALLATKKYIETTQDLIHSRQKTLRTALTNCYVINPYTCRATMNLVVPANSTESEIEYCKGLLWDYCQYDVLLSETKTRVDEIEENRQKIMKDYLQTFEYLYRRILPHNYLAASEVFPHFQNLWGYWERMQDNVVILMGLRWIFKTGHELIKILKYENNLTLNIPPRLEPEENLMEFAEFYKSVKIGAKVFTYANFNYIRTRKNIEYNGYCAWMLVLTDGVLIEGIKELGVVSYNNKFYIFSSVFGRESFARDPEQ